MQQDKGRCSAEVHGQFVAWLLLLLALVLSILFVMMECGTGRSCVVVASVCFRQFALGLVLLGHRFRFQSHGLLMLLAK